MWGTAWTLSVTGPQSSQLLTASFPQTLFLVCANGEDRYCRGLGSPHLKRRALKVEEQTNLQVVNR